MRCPHLDWSASRLYRTYGLYLLGRLRARPELLPIADEFSAAQSRLLQLIDQHRRSEEERTLALASREAALDDLNLAVQEFVHAVRPRTGSDARSALYRTYFPRGTRAVMRSPVGQRLESIRGLAAALEAETAAEIRRLGPPLAAALAIAEPAVAAYDRAALAFRRARAALSAGKVAWLDDYRRAHARLLIEYASHPRRAERFFRRLPAVRPEPQAPFAENRQGAES